MKAFILSILSITLVVVLILGNIHWEKNQPNASSKNTAETTDKEVSTQNTAETTASNNIEKYLTLAESWPEEAKEELEKKLTEKETYHIVLLGSKSIGDSKTGLFPTIKEKIESSFDKSVIVESIVYDKTTDHYVYSNEVKNLIKKKPDMVIFEPFTLNDNNKVSIRQSSKNITAIIEDTKKELPDATFVLQPPNPIYDAELYPKQVNVLQKYAKDNNITYLNHWEKWPDGDSQEVLDYIDSDDTPNAKGYEVWSNYLIDFLVHE